MERSSVFAEWFNGVVHKHQLAGVGTWSERLAVAMEDETGEYDSYLRRVANGKVAPGPAVTYRIGRGLREAGILWSSGALALLRNPRAYNVLLALVDIASRDKDLHASCVDWFYAADLTEAEELRSADYDAYTTEVLQFLAGITDTIAPAIESAFARYEKRGFRDADGLLGIAYQITSDKHSGPRASDARDLVVKGWLAEIPEGRKRRSF